MRDGWQRVVIQQLSHGMAQTTVAHQLQGGKLHPSSTTYRTHLQRVSGVDRNRRPPLACPLALALCSDQGGWSVNKLVSMPLYRNHQTAPGCPECHDSLEQATTLH